VNKTAAHIMNVDGWLAAVAPNYLPCLFIVGKDNEIIKGCDGAATRGKGQVSRFSPRFRAVIRRRHVDEEKENTGTISWFLACDFPNAVLKLFYYIIINKQNSSSPLKVGLPSTKPRSLLCFIPFVVSVLRSTCNSSSPLFPLSPWPQLTRSPLPAAQLGGPPRAPTSSPGSESAQTR
jgi:hypothetical protein